MESNFTTLLFVPQLKIEETLNKEDRRPYFVSKQISFAAENSPVSGDVNDFLRQAAFKC